MLIPGHQIGIHFLYLLCHKAKLRDASGVKLVLVMEGHWLERQDCFACLIHWVDGVFESLRGNDCAQVTAGINNHAHASSYGRSTDSGNISVGRSHVANTGSVLIFEHTYIADADIIRTPSEAHSRLSSQSDVFAGSTAEAEKGLVTYSDVTTAYIVGTTCRRASRNVIRSGGVGACRKT